MTLIEKILNSKVTLSCEYYKFITIYRHNVFLRNNKYYFLMYEKILKKQPLSKNQKLWVEAVITQWTDKDFIKFIEIMNEFVFLRDGVPFYDCVKKGTLLTDNGFRLLRRYVFECESAWWVFEYFRKNPSALNLHIYNLLVENKWVSARLISQAIETVKDEKVKDSLLTHLSVFSRFSRKYWDNNMTKQLACRVRAKKPLTHKQFLWIKDYVKDLKNSENKNVKYTEGYNVHFI
jgi:hypothetical protein